MRIRRNNPGSRSILAEAVRKHLERRRLSARQLAIAAHVDPKTVTELKKETFDPRLSKLDAIAAACGEPLWKMLRPESDEKDGPPTPPAPPSLTPLERELLASFRAAKHEDRAYVCGALHIAPDQEGRPGGTSESEVVALPPSPVRAPYSDRKKRGFAIKGKLPLLGAIALGLLPASYAHGGVAGWQTTTTVSKLTGTSTFSAALASSNRMRDGIGGREVATLVVRCTGPRLLVFVAWPDFIGVAPVRVRWKFDDGAISSAMWGPAADAEGTLVRKPGAFLMRMGQAETLVIDAPPHEGAPLEAVFLLSGAAGVLRDVATECPGAIRSR